jgi:hypothetical protein
LGLRKYRLGLSSILSQEEGKQIFKIDLNFIL